ncbi:hypothetical protein Tco_0780850 [Tanacetum coccineum]
MAKLSGTSRIKGNATSSKGNTNIVYKARVVKCNKLLPRVKGQMARPWHLAYRATKECMWNKEKVANVVDKKGLLQVHTAQRT